MRKARKFSKCFAPSARILTKFDSHARDFRHQKRRRLDFCAAHLASGDEHVWERPHAFEVRGASRKVLKFAKFRGVLVNFFNGSSPKFCASSMPCAKTARVRQRKRSLRKLQGRRGYVAAENAHVWHRTRVNFVEKRWTFSSILAIFGSHRTKFKRARSQACASHFARTPAQLDDR